MTEIDDEMIDRALDVDPTMSRALVRSILRAALNPKPEPEIEVSEGMLKEGVLAWSEEFHFIEDKGLVKRIAKYTCDKIYRRMESTHLKEAQEGAAYAAKDARQGASDARAEQTTGGGVWAVMFRHRRKGEESCNYMHHRRKDDPK